MADDRITYTAALDLLDRVIRELTELRDMTPLKRAETARNLSSTVRTVVGRVGDEAVSEAVYAPSLDNPDRIVGQLAVARRLGLAAPTINNACVNYRAWLDSQKTGRAS